MWSPRRYVWLVAVVLMTIPPARAGSRHGAEMHMPTYSHPGHTGHSGHGPGSTTSTFGVGGAWSSYGFPYYATAGPAGMFYFSQPVPVLVPMFLPMVPDRGVLAGPMPQRVVRQVAVVVPRPKKADPAKGSQLVVIGDRLFRAGNIKRAAERFEQAVKADPDAAAPHVRLAQVATVRGQFAEAARQIRDAIAAEPGWLSHAPDIQSIYAEPADFHRQLSRLESHVLVEPNDRDAWLVLGTELYLSGQIRRAADVFLRLTDRKPDPALAALLDASNAAPPEKAP